MHLLYAIACWLMCQDIRDCQALIQMQIFVALAQTNITLPSFLQYVHTYPCSLYSLPKYTLTNTIRKVVTAADNASFFNPTLRSNCIYLSGLSRRLYKNRPKNTDTLTFRDTHQPLRCAG